MKNALLCLLAASLVGGCTGARKYSRYDQFERIKVDQMSGNVVSGRIFGKTTLCLSARRESRLVTAVTNTAINSFTNQQVVYLTNVTVSTVTNVLLAASTNLAPALPPVTTSSGGDTNLVVIASAPAAGSTNTTHTASANRAVTHGPNQSTENIQAIAQFNNQVTAASNNLTVTTQTSRQVTAETNWVVVAVTNTAVNSVTNLVVTSTNTFARDYFLLIELLPPPEFTLATGESLVLLVDGERHGFSPANPQGVFVARKGFVSTFYRTSPETLGAIASAREVRVRLKGVNNVIERKLPRGAQKNFRDFIVRYLQPDETTPVQGEASAVSIASSEHARLD